MECIVLAGGLGTRLRGVIGELPKCMAPVGGKPFLHWLFRYLERQGCTRCVLSLGYKHEAVLEWLQNHPPAFETGYVLEHEPLGTGGGIALALQACREADVVIVNGDTLFDADLKRLRDFHTATGAETTLALKGLRHFERYGTVETLPEGAVVAFHEKQPCAEGLINGGIYLVRKNALPAHGFPEKFSFEKDYLERATGSGALYGLPDEGYFIDIGVPEDYERAQTEVPALLNPS